MSSRQPIIDIIELVSNLIASASHLQELIDNEEDIDKKESYIIELYELIDIRRAVMKEIECGDKLLRCSLKHAIGQRGFAVEIWYAMRTTFWYDVMVYLTKFMYKILSGYMGKDIVDCSRCLMDMVLSTEEKNETDNKTE